MRAAWMVVPLILAGCGKKEVALPADPIQRAATCGVVATADARRASANVEAKLTLEQQGRILHYALLAAADGGGFDQDRSAAVIKAMPSLGDKVTTGKWEPLIAACEAAYPATKASGAVTLPADTFTAQAGCHDLADFVTSALRTQEADYIDRIRPYDAMERKLDDRMGSKLQQRGLSQAQGAEARDKAMAEMIRLGSPIAVLEACEKRFGP
jgi:hypothetical protein